MPSQELVDDLWRDLGIAQDKLEELQEAVKEYTNKCTYVGMGLCSSNTDDVTKLIEVLKKQGVSDGLRV